MEFRDVIRSEEELRALMGDPVAQLVVDKTLSALDRHCLTFIARSPFVLVATSDGGGADGRVATFRNLFQSPRVGLMFLIPGKRETLRIGGRAEVVRDAALLESLNAQGKVPALAIAVHVDEPFFIARNA